MQEQVETSGRRVKDLKKTLEDKRDQLEKFNKNAKELKESNRVQIENLKKARADLGTERLTQESGLNSRGATIKEANEKRH